MTDDVNAWAGQGAPEPNPALKGLDVLVGEWDVDMSFPADPSGTVRGHATFEWLEEGAYLIMRMGDRAGTSPWSLSTIGRDDASGTYTMLYFDWRGVSRIYHMSLEGREWKQWRDAPGFSQRFAGTLSEDGNTITARWEKSFDGATWEHDFDLTYTRVE
jgi:hypothetical protein